MRERLKNIQGRQVLAWGVRAAAAVALTCAIVVFLGESVLEMAGRATTHPATAASAQGFGHTLDALTGANVTGATVSVNGLSFTSDANGIYTLSGLSNGEKIAVVTRTGRVPTAFHFSVYTSSTGVLSVHTPPAYLLATQGAVSIPSSGGTLIHGQYRLTFPSGGFSASLTGFGEHPGAPPPPDVIPTASSPQPPRPPVLGTASSTEHAFPQALFYATFPTSYVAQVTVPLGVAGADPAGSLLPLLRFNTATTLWERVGDLAVINSTTAQGNINRGGLYMAATVARILNDAVTPTGTYVEVTSPYASNAVNFTQPSTFSIEPGTSSDVRKATTWIYGWRQGGGNLTGVKISYPAPATATGSAGVNPSPSPTATSQPPCPPGFTCRQGETPCIVPPSTVNGCGSKVSFGGVCTCCPPGTACQVRVRSGGALDQYDISVGIQEILRQIQAKGQKRKGDVSIDAGCYPVPTPSPSPSPTTTASPTVLPQIQAHEAAAW